MHGSQHRILTTHTGSLPRPRSLLDLLIRQERGETIDQGIFDRQVEEAVKGVIDKQLTAGIDIGNDGEQPRPSFAGYVTQRMTGFGGGAARPPWRDFVDFPDVAALWQQRMAQQTTAAVLTTPQAIAEIEYTNLDAAAQECDLFVRCAKAFPQQFTERFMTAVSPGMVATYLLNAYYDSHENYVLAVARQLKKEYELIHAKGLLLQIDAPDLACDHAWFFQHLSLQEFKKVVEANITAINLALENVPADSVRLHVCWANIDSPHVHDVPLAYDPGSDSAYSNLTSHLLGIIVARACDTDLKSFAQEHLFDPLGIEPAFWQVDWDGNYLGFSDIHLSSTDLAKFGSLYMNDGQYNRIQLFRSSGCMIRCKFTRRKPGRYV